MLSQQAAMAVFHSEHPQRDGRKGGESTGSRGRKQYATQRDRLDKQLFKGMFQMQQQPSSISPFCTAGTFAETEKLCFVFATRH